MKATITSLGRLEDVSVEAPVVVGCNENVIELRIKGAEHAILGPHQARELSHVLAMAADVVDEANSRTP